MIEPLVLVIALVISACGREAEETTAERSAAGPGAVAPVDTRMSKTPPKIPRPKDQAQLDRMILAGYVPHDDHLHAPGSNECPLTKGTDVVM